MSVAERSQIQFGSTRIEYGIRRSSRRGTVSIAVDARDGVLLTAPSGTAVQRLDQLVRDKAWWIVERLRRHGEVPEATSSKEFVSGETFFYLGKQHRLRVLRNAKPRPLILRRGWMEIGVPRGLPASHHGAYARAALVDWYRKRALERLPKLVGAWAKKAGVSNPTVLVREQRKRWASCHPSGVVRVNWRVVQAAPRLIDYVLAHEVVHLVHDDHGTEFWRLLGRVMPDYDGRRAELRRVGARFEW